MSMEELQEKVVQLQKYKLAEEKEKKKEEALRAKQGKAVRKALVVEKQKTRTAEKKREREVETLTKTVAQLEEAELLSTQKILEFDEKVKARVDSTRQGHAEKYQALQDKMLATGGAKGKLSHLQFAVKSLETNLILPVEFSRPRHEQDSQNWANRELTVALQEEVDQLQEESRALEDENRRLREELEEVRCIIDAPDETEESEDYEEPSDDESVGDGDTSASAVGHGAGASMPTVSPRTNYSPPALSSPVPRDDPEARGAAIGIPALGASAAVAMGVGYTNRSSWPLQGAERPQVSHPSRMSTPGSVRGAYGEISPFMPPRIFATGVAGSAAARMPPTEPLVGQQVVQHVTVDALRQLQRLQGDVVPGGA